MVWRGAQEGNAGGFLFVASYARHNESGGVRGYVGAVPAEHSAMGTAVQDRIRQGKTKRGLIKGKKWLLLSRWNNLTVEKRGALNRLFQMNRRVFKAYMLKESLEKLWDYEKRMFNYLEKWVGQLKWQRLKPFEKLADMLIEHLDGILNYCKTKVRFGVVEALNGNIRMLINRGRGYKNVRYLLLKAKRMAVTNLQFVELQRVRKAA